jgi:valyl-tRNA synthetase
MMGLECMGRAPFRDVVIHGTILDDQGRKMSKSLGNGIDPLDMIERYGADAVRFTLADLATEGQDIKLAETRFEKGRNFCTKLLNGARFAIEFGLQELDPAPAGPERLEDRWIRSRAGAALREAGAALAEYRFSELATVLFRFFWDEWCANYLELVKPRLREPGPDRAQAQRTLGATLSVVLRLLHPVLPHLTERIWARLAATPGGAAAGATGMLAVARWPEATPADVSAEQLMDLTLSVARAVRNIRAKNTIPPSRKVKVVVSAAAETDVRALEAARGVLEGLAGASEVTVGQGLAKPSASAAEVVGTLQVFVPIGGIIDRDREIDRMRKQLGERRDHLLGMRRKLENEAFLQKAPRHVVDQLRDKVREVEDEIAKVRRNLEDLGAAE